MAKRRHLRRRKSWQDRPISWLPIDSRVINPLFSFTSVRGAARLFLEIEIVLSIGVVIGTLVLLLLSLFS